MSGASKPLAGVLGSPVTHSLSPRLHGYWLTKYAIPGFYVPMDVAESDLREVLRTMPRMGFVGCNVTIPHKEAVLGLAREVSERAMRIGAANTLTFDGEGRIRADNTDGIGFLENLRTNAPGWAADAGPACVLGAGGAARAILAALIEAGVPEIRLANRTRARAEALREAFGERVAVWDWTDAGEAIDGAATLVNTTSLGMRSHPPLDVPLRALAPGMVVTDIVYSPLETGLLRVARKTGCVAVDGLGMLIHQAVPGFERWFSRRPDVDEGLRAALLA